MCPSQRMNYHELEQVCYSAVLEALTYICLLDASALIIHHCILQYKYIAYFSVQWDSIFVSSGNDIGVISFLTDRICQTW